MLDGRSPTLSVRLPRAHLARPLLAVLVVGGLAALLVGRDHPEGGAGALPRGEIVRRSLPGRPDLDYFIFVPDSAGPKAPLLVCIHGMSRRAESLLRPLRTRAERAGVVLLAPLFERGTFDDYQRLGRYGRGARSDLALERLVAELERSADVSAARFSLLGHSGGAQFVHRYVLAHPDRVSAAVASSAGWYTFPDPDADYPYGLDDIGELDEIRFAPDRFLRTPVLVIVGSLDVARGNALRREIRIDRVQGRTRLERAQRWAEAMNLEARERGLPPPVTLDVVPGVKHSFRDHVETGRLPERAFDFLFTQDRPGA